MNAVNAVVGTGDEERTGEIITTIGSRGDDTQNFWYTNHVSPFANLISASSPFTSYYFHNYPLASPVLPYNHPPRSPLSLLYDFHLNVR
jgi:hypothetical protein